MRLGFLLWGGSVGGAQTVTASLVGELRRRGHDASVLFVTTPQPLSHRLEQEAIPYFSLDFERGSRVIFHPRRLADAASERGSDGVVTPSPGYLPACLRLGGYRGRLVAVNHGRLLQEPALRSGARAVRRLDRASGFWAADEEVAVSDFLLERLRRKRLRARRLVRIYNGLDLDRYALNGSGTAENGPFRVSWAGRMIPGKGVDDLLRAIGAIAEEVDVQVHLAGDGPDRPFLHALAGELGISSRVDFAGWVEDMPAFWRATDVAVVPSHQWLESFGMVAVEAMACGRPVVVSRNGGLPEVVEAGETGEIFEPGDAAALAETLRRYATDPDRRRRHGEQARARCARLFGIGRAADSYLELFSAD